MEQIIFRPSLFKFETCKEFSEAFDLKKGDLILTNQYIYDPYFGKLGLEVSFRNNMEQENQPILW